MITLKQPNQFYKQFKVTFFVLMLLILTQSIVIINEYELALTIRLGEPRKELKAGIHFIAPFIDTVERFDGRLQIIDTPPERVITSKQKPLELDAYLKWKITDVIRFYRINKDMLRAENNLKQLMASTIRYQFSNRTIKEVVSGERDELVTVMTHDINEKAQNWGIEIPDFRVKKVDLPTEIMSSVFKRMRSERESKAALLRAEGSQTSQEIIAKAKVKETKILSDAYVKSQETRAKADLESAEIYAKAYAADADFYNFTRGCDALKNAFSENKNMLVVGTDSPFLKLIDDPKHTIKD
ncbi:protease modulator HflC [Chlamydiia bacterium]|nr:protease modulator HflC [Chlamydiia bacterium]